MLLIIFKLKCASSYFQRQRNNKYTYIEKRVISTHNITIFKINRVYSEIPTCYIPYIYKI